MLEGTIAGVPPKGGRKHPEQSLVQFDTRNVLFICGGAFDGLAAEIARRLSHAPIGFSATGSARIESNDPTLFRHVEPDDLLRFGLIPELVGRLPLLTALDGLALGARPQGETEPADPDAVETSGGEERGPLRIALAINATFFVVEFVAVATV